MPIVVANILFGQSRLGRSLHLSIVYTGELLEILGISKHCIFRQELLRVHTTKKYIDSTIRFNGFGAVNRRNEMTYVDRFSGNLGLKGNLKFYDEDGVASKEQMSLSINPVLFKSTNSRVEGTLLRYPLTMTNAGSGLYRFDTGLKNIGTSNGVRGFSLVTILRLILLQLPPIELIKLC